MICFLAIIVFGIMGIFSVTYRRLAAEAFDCTFRKATFRKCRSNLDERIKSRISAKILPHSPKLSRLVFRHFTVISYLFVIITVVSTVLVANSVYNYVRYGNCNGPDSSAFCIINEITGDEKTVQGCNTPECDPTKCSCLKEKDCTGECEGCSINPPQNGI